MLPGAHVPVAETVMPSALTQSSSRSTAASAAVSVSASSSSDFTWSFGLVKRWYSGTAFTRIVSRPASRRRRYTSMWRASIACGSYTAVMPSRWCAAMPASTAPGTSSELGAGSLSRTSRKNGSVL